MEDSVNIVVAVVLAVLGVAAELAKEKTEFSRLISLQARSYVMQLKKTHLKHVQALNKPCLHQILLQCLSSIWGSARASNTWGWCSLTDQNIAASCS